MTWEFLLGIAGLVFIVLVFVSIVLFIAGLIVDAFRTRNGNDHEPPTLDVQNHIGDPDDPTSGVH